MNFIGQQEIQKEVIYLIEDLRRGNNYNILLRAPSGYGKTLLGSIILIKADPELKSSFIYSPENGVVKLKESKRFHFIDEAHTLEQFEWLYPLMDSERFTFIFGTNESGHIPEPLRNRCIPFVWRPYTTAEMVYIVRDLTKGWSFSDDIVVEIVNRSRGTPRVASMIVRRLSYIFRERGVPTTSAELITILEEILQINSDGLGRNERTYLDFLSRVERSSLINISRGTGIDKETIQQEIEPYLIYKGIIKISSKGREICQ